ncbi:hypothetical protein ES703_06620 [subsurface metagenome]
MEMKSLSASPSFLTMAISIPFPDAISLMILEEIALIKICFPSLIVKLSLYLASRTPYEKFCPISFAQWGAVKIFRTAFSRLNIKII